MSEAGFAEGQDVAIEYRWAENQYEVPIAFAFIIDPVGAGFVESVPRPDDNMTDFMLPAWHP